LGASGDSVSLPRLAGGYRAAAAALVDLGRGGEAREVIGQLLQAFPKARIDSDFIRRQNRSTATSDSWIAALRLAGVCTCANQSTGRPGTSRRGDRACADARRNRVRLSQAEIAPIQWIVIIVLAVLIQITLAMLHIGNRLAMAITMFIFSTAIAVCLVLLMVYHRPFGVGGFVTEATVLRDIMPE
jgi:hypothetical protein